MTLVLVLLIIAVVVSIALNRRTHARAKGLESRLHSLSEKVQTTINELAHDKAHLSTILASMVEAVVAVGIDGKVIASNPAVGKFFGIDHTNLEGKHYLEVLRHSEIDQLIQAVLANHQAKVDEVRTFAPDEQVFEAHADPLLQEGKFAGVLLVLHDITRMRKLEQIRRDFVANVSHELRTPLASIKGFAETLSSGGLDDVKHRAEFVESIENQANRMTQLIDDLLDLAAIESGKRKPNQVSVSLLELAKEVSDGLKPLARKQKILFIFKEATNLPAVLADKDQLKQVFSNLYQNAIKFNNGEGTITVSAEADENMVRVSIEDTGVGIPKSDLPRIFERFYRVDKARSREMGGTGLGLSIVKHIVESHNGTVGVDSVEGRGSTFFFSIPLS